MAWFNSQKVNNPFKEQQSLWIRYAVLICISSGLTFVVVRWTPPSTTTMAPQVTHSRPLVHVPAVDKEGNEELQTQFQNVDQDNFRDWFGTYFRLLEWPIPDVRKPLLLTRKTLIESLRLGCTNIAENQNAAGSFNYQYNFVTREMDHDDSEVRQAGALWGISLCYQHDPSNSQYKTAVEKGIRFFSNHTVLGPKHGTIMVRYPDDSSPMSSTGTNALFGLGMIEYLRTVDVSDPEINEEFVQQVRSTLEGIINHLQSMQLPNKHFAQQYNFVSGKPSHDFSPYFDGETMLCLVKAAKYLDGFVALIPIIEDASMILAKSYSVDAWASDGHDSDQTKGFYQWSSMFLTEYYYSGWNNAQFFGDFVIALSHWIIYTHDVLNRRKNTGYAFEGIISAYEIAKEKNDEVVIHNLESAIDKGLYKLCSWQVGGPLARENEFLVHHPTSEKIAIGGIMGARNQPDLRIDTTQHQMHSLIMALTSVYTN